MEKDVNHVMETSLGRQVERGGKTVREAERLTDEQDRPLSCYTTKDVKVQTNYNAQYKSVTVELC